MHIIHNEKWKQAVFQATHLVDVDRKETFFHR